MSNNAPLLLDELRRHTRLLESILKIVKNHNGTDEEYLTVNQTAKMLKRSPTTIRRLIAANKIDGIKINNGSPRDRYLIPRASIQRFIQGARI